MPEFVRARHPEVDAEAVLPVTAFPYMPGWEPVDSEVTVPTLADGTVDEVLAAVGDDPVKAAAALDAERSGKNRKTLIEALAAIADPTSQES